MTQDVRKQLFEPIMPYRQFHLSVGTHLKDGSCHRLYVEEVGNPEGIPVFILHGGPGGGSSPDMRRFLDARKWRMIIFDQRGCGASTPHANLEDNTTFDLVADIEAIREHLGIKKAVVFGGSWGSTLALAYAVTHPEKTLGLILRGIFLITRAEVNWLYQDGAKHIFPDAFEAFIAPIPESERGDLVSAYHGILTSDDAPLRQKAANAWSRWEGNCLSMAGPLARPDKFDDDHFAEAFAQIENHFFIHEGFLPYDGWLLDMAKDKLQHIPIHIVHGRYDMVTPLQTAWALKKALPHAQLNIVPDAGHSSGEPGIVDGLVQAGEDMANLYGKAAD